MKNVKRLLNFFTNNGLIEPLVIECSPPIKLMEIVFEIIFSFIFAICSWQTLFGS